MEIYLIEKCVKFLLDISFLFFLLFQSLFEGSMYTFVFMWTPALTDASKKDETPHGLIFATFMVACMGGASLFNIFSQSYTVRSLLWKPVAVSAVALFVPVVTDNITISFLSFIVFEVCVGMYFPIIGTIKSEVVAEETRSAVYNLFRVPLNIIVLAVLLSNVQVKFAFLCSAIMLTIAAILSVALQRHTTSDVLSRSHSGELGLLQDESAGEDGHL
jgi:MFS family permease